jgi:hypothetical protein
MTLLTFFGCALTGINNIFFLYTKFNLIIEKKNHFIYCIYIAYGPSLALFFLTIAKDAQLVILMISR